MSSTDHGKDRFQDAFRVSSEVLGRLEIYQALLTKWNPVINLVSPATVSEFWSRHVLDSASLLQIVGEDAKTWVDLGSGGGFPGAVVAIVAGDGYPDLRVTCIESDRRKATFLQNVSRETGVSFSVIAARIEEAPEQRAEIVSARALAPLDKLIGYAHRHLSPDGSMLFPKGRRYAEELEHARNSWQFECEQHQSMTDPDAVILKLRNIRHV